MPFALFTDELLVTIAAAALCFAFFYFVLALTREEHRLNARGETLYPGMRSFNPRRIRTRTDDALLRGTRGLVDNDDPSEVIARLHEGTHRGDALPDGTPRLYYDMAVSCLEDAASRREWELRARELLEAEMWLWAAMNQGQDPSRPLNRTSTAMTTRAPTATRTPITITPGMGQSSS